ncbi:hypothetical protein [Jeotgalibacillus soli]|uniref:Transporter n=1 Tax=Jeotgalibacillus soli TaxID=889306 RepID=A0A0C2RVK4_9BACL|nr:hypothetical protein [Jeotgalibacillus soli]KIL45799.1 hypothetical protein KP78_21480 [Jeotgalibacillus soli]
MYRNPYGDPHIYYENVDYEFRISPPAGGIPFPGSGAGTSGGLPFPGGGPGPGSGFPFPAGGSQSQSSGPPASPPPQQIPPKPFRPQGTTTFMVDPNVIRPCLFRFTYIWLTNGSSFWYYPIVIGRNSVGGFHWDRRRFRWVYLALDTRFIDVVSC